MKFKIHFVSIFLILAFSCKTNSDKSSEPITEGIAKEYYSNGVLKSETDSKDGKANGLMKNYNKDGVLESVSTFKDGIKHGPSVSYYPGGELKLKMYFNNGKREGTSLWYYRTGETFRESIYKNGKIEGIVKSFYQNGKLMSEAPYLENYAGIELKEYDEKGTIIKDDTRIIVKALNTKPIEGKVFLEIHLSDEKPGTSFFLGELTDGKFLNEALFQLPYEFGKSRYTVTYTEGDPLPKPIRFSAIFQTDKSNYRVVTKTYRLSLEK